MPDKLPVDVFKYMLEHIPPYMGLLMIKTDKEGLIEESIGDTDHYLNKKVKNGDAIEDTVPSLTGILPLKENTLHLKKIELKPDVIADIHVVKEGNNHWIIFVDQTTEADTLRLMIQNMNEQELEKKQRSQENPFENYYILDFAVFKKERKRFKLLPKVPEWIEHHELYRKKQGLLNPIEAFPYLEVFILEVEEFWNKKEDGYQVSDMWSEEIDHKMYHLRAFAVNFNKENFLLVKSFNKEGKEEQKLVQAYRDSSLAFDKLAKAERKLKELLEYKNKFNSIISHDLRSPIAAVLGVLDIILSDEVEIEKLNEDYQEFLWDIRSEMERLLEYNNRLYHWSNLELGNFKLDIKEVPLDQIIRTAYKTALNSCEKKGILLEMQTDENIHIKVDEALFSQALNNLLSNAVKFTPPGEKIIVKGVEQDNEVFVSVIDSGVGMPEKVKNNLFKNTSIESTLGTSGEKGTGLGLDIVKKIITAHQFDISVESEENKGTTFTIHIPASFVVKIS